MKICGMTRPEDARVAEESGASYVGAVLVPGSPRELSASSAFALATSVGIPLVVVVADLDLEETVRVAMQAGAGGIQLHGEEPPEMVEDLRERGDWELWKAVRVRSRQDVLRAVERFGGLVDLLLLDGWRAGMRGGTGTSFPWEALHSVREEIPEGVRIGVAGGLSPENVEDAVLRLKPDLVDVSSGVESVPGEKDHERVRAFVSRALASR